MTDAYGDRRIPSTRSYMADIVDHRDCSAAVERSIRAARYSSCHRLPPPPPLSVSELDNLMERRDVDRVIITVNAPNGKAAIAADILPSPVRGGSALSKREWLRQLQGPPQESDLNLIMLMMSTSTRLSGDPPSMPDREMGLVASISYRVELDSHYLPCDLGPAAMDAARSAWFVDISLFYLPLLVGVVTSPLARQIRTPGVAPFIQKRCLRLGLSLRTTGEEAPCLFGEPAGSGLG